MVSQREIEAIEICVLSICDGVHDVGKVELCMSMKGPHLTTTS